MRGKKVIKAEEVGRVKMGAVSLFKESQVNSTNWFYRSKPLVVAAALHIHPMLTGSSATACGGVVLHLSGISGSSLGHLHVNGSCSCF